MDTKTPELTRWRLFNFMPKPALAAAMVVLAAVLAVIIIQVIPFTAPAPGKGAFNDLSKSFIVKNPLQVIEKVESPIESEMRTLGHSINSAAKFLVSRLDVKIEQQ